MKVLFIQCPSWLLTSPPFAIALLGNVLKKGGHEVKCIDLNIEFYHKILSNKHSKNAISLESWKHNNIEVDFDNIEYVKKLIYENESLIESYIHEIIAFNPQIICFSVHNTSALFSLEFTRILKCKFPNKIIFWGGPYCFVRNENIDYLINEMQEIDAICSGDGEQDISNIFTNFEQNGFFNPVEGYYFRNANTDSINNVYKSISSNINNVAFQDYSFFNFEKYTWECLPVIASRGCYNRCSFCNEWTCWTHYQFRSPDKIVSEIKYLKQTFPQIQSFWLTCSNLSGDIDSLNKLCDSLISENINILWESQLSIRKTVNLELLVKMKKAGCNYLNYGLESSSNKILKLMNKGYDKKLAYQVLNDTAKANINFNFNIIVGFPGENTSNFIETLFFIKRFAKNSIYESIAKCTISNHSKLHQDYIDYSILNRDSENWFTIGSRNTPYIRGLRLKFAKQLYNSEVLNVFFFQKKFLKFINWFYAYAENQPLKSRRTLMRELSGSNFQYLLKYSLIVFRKPLLFNLKFLEYLIFYLWVIYLFSILKIIEFFSNINDIVCFKSSREKQKRI